MSNIYGYLFLKKIVWNKFIMFFLDHYENYVGIYSLDLLKVPTISKLLPSSKSIIKLFLLFHIVISSQQI